MKKRNMCDFVNGECEAIEAKEKFVTAWLKTHGDPCSVCDKDKTNCKFFKTLSAEKAAQDESGKEPGK